MPVLATLALFLGMYGVGATQYRAFSSPQVVLNLIAAVVIGGTLLTGGFGYLFGTVVGGSVLGLIQTQISFDGRLSSWWTKIFTGVLLLAFILLQRLVTSRRR